MSTDRELLDLRTEQRNSASAELDTMSALGIAQVMNAEDAKVPLAVARALPQIARAIDAVAEAIAAGGRLIYVGTGTSGRVAALDASETPPTFGLDANTVQYIIAGGDKALGRAVEACEDDAALGRRDMAKRKPRKRDVVAGIAASGRTPYTVAAVEYARRHGARTFAITCNPDTPLERAAEIAITVDVGPEVVTGSTRLKAGTAEKLVTNMLTTGAMARLGHVYGNLMIHVVPKNSKLRARAIAIIEELAQVDQRTALRTLQAAGNSVPVALVMLKASLSRSSAQKRLKEARGNVRKALE